jgi:hypothetical protein
MKKLHIVALLALAGVGVFAPGAQAATTTYNTDDLFLGFRQDGNSTADILIDLGPSFNFRDGLTTGSLNSIIGTGLGSLLTANFGNTWFTDGTVHWGIVGTSGGSLITTNGVQEFPNTLYISNPETNSGAPTANINATQALATSAITTMKGQWVGLTTSSGLLNGLVQTPGSTTWSGEAAASFNDNTQFSAFEGIVGSSTLDLYRLTRTSSSSAADGNKGFFTIDSTGQVSYNTAVPEPTAITMLGGAGMLFLARRRRKSVVA